MATERRKKRQSGQEIVEFAVLAFLFVGLFMGGFITGMSLIRSLQANQVCANLSNMYIHGADFSTYGMQQLATIPGVRLVGTAQDKASVMSFVLAGYSTDEVGKALNKEGIAVRTGHHCAQPIVRRMGLETTVRPSLAFYNTFEEVDLLVAVVQRLAAARAH